MFSEKSNGKIRALWWIFIIVSYLLLGVFSAQFNLNRSTIKTLFWCIFAIAILLWYVINQFWYKDLLKKINALSPILKNDKNPDKYIAENLVLLKDKSSMQIIALLNMNICMAYCEKHEYENAKNCLMNIKENKIHGILKLCYYINLIYVLFYLNEIQDAIALLDKKRIEILKFNNSQQLGPIISILLIFEMISKKDDQKSIDLINISEKRWKSKDTADDFLYLRSLCQNITR